MRVLCPSAPASPHPTRQTHPRRTGRGQPRREGGRWGSFPPFDLGSTPHSEQMHHVWVRWERDTPTPSKPFPPPKRRTECPVPPKQKEETPRGRWRRGGQGSKRRRYDGPFIRRGRKPVAPSPTNRTEVESDRCQSYGESNRGRNEKKPIATRS